MVIWEITFGGEHTTMEDLTGGGRNTLKKVMLKGENTRKRRGRLSDTTRGDNTAGQSTRGR